VDVVHTERLTLRSARASDAGRFIEILSNWNVVRMLRLVPHPYTRAHAEDWIASHAIERAAGTAFRFVVERDERMIGTCDIDEIADGAGDLGYWLDEAAWGQGIATEAARAVMAFAMKEPGLERLTSGHAADNPASGRVLTKLGFRKIGETRVWSNPRVGEIEQWRYAYRPHGAVR
jgi:RimJ/RimL family protein N-acetyltransferase